MKKIIFLIFLLPFLAHSQTLAPVTLQPKSDGSNPVKYVPFTYPGKPDGMGNLADLKATAMYVTIAQLRAFPGVLPTSNFYITDAGKEGVAIFDPTDEASSDDGVLVFVTAGSRRVKRVIGSTYNASWYGADPTGTADATTAILNAANAASTANKDLVFSPGTYKLTAANSTTSSIDLTGKYVHWKFIGATLKQTTAQTVPVIKLTSSDVDIQGMIGWGIETAGTYPAASNINAFIDLVTCDKGKLTDTYIYGKSVGIFLETSTNTRIDRYTFDGLFSAETVVPGAAYTGRNYHNAIRVNAGAHNYISNIKSANTGSLVLVGLNATDTHISHGYVTNFFDNGVYISSSNGAEISYIHAINGEGTGVKTRGSNNTTSYCFVSGTSVGFGATGNGNSDVYGFNGSGSSISYCRAENITRHGIVIGTQDGFYPQLFKVIGNTIVNAASEATDYTSILVQGSNHLISGNTIIGSTAAQAIEVSSLPDTSRNITIDHNIIRKTSGGISLYQTVSSLVDHNVLDSINTNYGIRISSASKRNIVSENTTNLGFTGLYELYIKPSDNNTDNQLRGNVSNSNNADNTNFRTNKFGFAEYNSLPTASLAYQSQFINVTSTGSNSDQTYVGQRGSGGTSSWKKIVQNLDDVIVEGSNATHPPTFTNASIVTDGNTDVSFQYKTNGALRWTVGKANTSSDANSGSNAGSNLRWTYYDDITGTSHIVGHWTRLGRLGLNGVTSPSNPLHVLGFVRADGGFIVSLPSTGIGTISPVASSGTVVGVGTNFNTDYKIGDQITATTSSGSETHTISAIASAISMTTDAWTGNGTNVAYTTNANGNRMQINGNGDITINKFTTAGVLHNSSGGLVSTSTIATADIANNAVTYAKMQAMTTNKLLGSGSGTAVAEITLGTGLSFSGTTLNATNTGTVTGGTINWPGTIYTTPTTGTVSSGTLTFAPALTAQTANTHLAGPTSGGSAVPTFRALVAADIPDLSASYIKLQTGTPSAQTGAIDVTGSIIGGSDVTASTLVATSGAYIPAPAYSSGTYKIAVINTTGSNHVETITGHLVIYTSDASTTNVSKSYLNTNYSTYLPGDVVYLPAANLKYIKMDSSSTGNWDEQPYNQTP